MGKKTGTRDEQCRTGRGVWESNPPGTAPSDPPAVLKTVRPTGAPTPPYLSVCRILPCLFSPVKPISSTLIFRPSLAFVPYGILTKEAPLPHRTKCPCRFVRYLEWYTNKRGTTSSPDLPQTSFLPSTSSYSSTTRGTT
jgi:hypothetical protein